ncbi:glutamate racemase [Pantoea sp. Nvir]|uniref:glutamate racemase n=1 Tax=Pantoea sp. Nvir TaxID=2576760 RepID=UPI0027EE30DE|nr:glutamate racemase [Pantoea sp. Nvir]CAJ0990693.1 Glutamate racemase [Pantoea sp. Nvir]
MTTKLQKGNITSKLVTSNSRPTVLVFDSGVGGLSVYDEVRQRLPDLCYIYAFDNVGFPYGEKSEEYIIERVVHIVVGAIARRYSISLCIIACNTASTVSLPALRTHFDFPVIGVVPAIKPAVRLTRNGVVGLLATRATVQRSYIHHLVSQFATSCQIVMLGSAELVKLAEEKLHGQTISLHDVRRIIQPWLLMREPPDTAILGCTHFPLLRQELQQVLPKGTYLIDSGTAIARRTAWLLEHEIPSVQSSHINCAFCTELNSKVLQLSPTLKHYGFPSLEKVVV